MPDSRFHPAPGPVTLAEAAALAGADLAPGADPGLLLTGVAPLALAGPGDLAFVGGAKYLGALAQSAAGACIVPPALLPDAAGRAGLLVARDPKAAWAAVARALYPEPAAEAGISPLAAVAADAVLGPGCAVAAFASIGAGAEIGAGCVIGPGAAVGAGVVLGPGCRIGAGASVSHARVGARCVLHPGVRIGQDGFGYVAGPGGPAKVPQLGRVLIGADVEIGANSAIDRGAGEDTVIGEATKIDNLVHIAHNCRIGRGCLIMAQAGIAGGSVLGDGVLIGGQVAVRDHVTIGSGAMLAPKSGVSKDVPAGGVHGGIPAMDLRQWKREVAALRRLARRAPG